MLVYCLFFLFFLSPLLLTFSYLFSVFVKSTTKKKRVNKQATTRKLAAALHIFLIFKTTCSAGVYSLILLVHLFFERLHTRKGAKKKKTAKDGVPDTARM